MKTILIAHNYSQSSFASMSYCLAHHLAEIGYRVVFISHHPYFSQKLFVKKEEGEIIVCSWPTEKRPTSLKDLFWYANLYFKYKPDIVVGHFVGSNITIAMSKILSFGKVKTIEYYHTLRTQILEDLIQLSLKQKLFFVRKKIFYKLFCDLIICPSAMAKKDLKKYYGIAKGSVVLNPMMDRFTLKTVLASDSIIISYLGRLDTSKGVLDLVTAFEEYQKIQTDSKIILNIAGMGSQGTKIRELVGNNRNLVFLGGLAYDKIDDYLNKSHFTIIPSKFDNLPTVGLESMMNQTPLLISNTTGLAHYLTEEIDCFKFDPNRSSMIELFGKVEQNFYLQEQMGINARATFLKTFSIENYCSTFSKIIG